MRLAFLAVVLFMLGVAPGIAHHGHSWPVISHHLQVSRNSPHHVAKPGQVWARLVMLSRKFAISRRI